ncbi:hypothetical protein P4C99_20020 [Pontiellaceae bacterium B1224]|nr:hypothetical protein [Pontiellaceae bacterium B1224]
MRIVRLITIFTTLALSVHAQVQSISGQLKAADCHFLIKNDGKDVQTLDQKITLRAVSEKDTVVINSREQVYGSGYRSYHLEFAYTKDHPDRPIQANSIEFLNDKDELIHRISLLKNDRTMAESEQTRTLRVRYMAVSLQGIPLTLLDDVAVINFLP